MDEPNNLEDNDTNQLFDQDNNEEDDFEIPAFKKKKVLMTKFWKMNNKPHY